MSYDNVSATAMPDKFLDYQKTPETGGEIIEKYKALEGERLYFLYAGHYLDRVTLGDELILGTELSPMSAPPPPTGAKMRQIVDKPMHDVGGRCIRGLSSRQHQYLFPQNAQYFRLSVPTIMGRALGIDENAPETIQSLNHITDDVLAYLDENQVLNKIKRQLERINLEGQGMIHVREEGIRTIPLRSFAVMRNGTDGKIRYAIICESAEGKGNYYTFVDYENDEVYQVDETSKSKKKLPESCVQYIVVCPRINPFTNFAYAYAYSHLPMLGVVNSLMRGVDRHAFLMALTALINDDDSGQSNDELERLLGESIFAAKVENGKPKYIGFFSAEVKINETAMLEQLIVGIVKRLEQAFALNIFGDPVPVLTATQSSIMNKQFEDEINSHCSGLIQTLLVPLINAVLWVLGYSKVVGKQDSETGQWVATKVKSPKQGQSLIEVEAIAGISQLTRQIQLQEMGQYIAMAFQLNPAEAAQRISVVNFVQLAALINNLPAMDMIFVQPQQQQQPMNGQAQQPQMTQQAM